MSPRPFASANDLDDRVQTFEVLADGVYALTAEGDPNIGAIEGEDFVVCFEALATPLAAGKWLELLRRHTDKPVRYLVLSHYHAVRVLGAAAYDAAEIVAHETTAALIIERGLEDWESEFERFPRFAKGAETIPGLTHPTLTFSDRMTIDLGGDRGDLVLEYVGRGHTEGDLVAWLPQQKILFAGDLVEAQAALYTGDAFHRDWSTTTLDRIREYGAEILVGGRGTVSRGHDEVGAAIEQTRHFIRTLITAVENTQQSGGTLLDAFTAAHAALFDDYGHWPIFEHCLPFDVSRAWDELAGIERPVIWTPARDRAVWNQLQR